MHLPIAKWEAALAFYLKSADARLPTPEPNVADPFHVLNALQGLIGAAPTSSRPRLMQTVECMETVLNVRLDWDILAIHMNDASAARYAQVKQFWYAHCAEHYAPIPYSLVRGAIIRINVSVLWLRIRYGRTHHHPIRTICYHKACFDVQLF